MLLFVAQTLAVTHAYQHDLGTPVDTSCASCIVSGQLASGCADSAADHAPATDVGVHEICEYRPTGNANVPAAKQRGPPI